MHHPAAAGVKFDGAHPQPGQAKQNRRTVLHKLVALRLTALKTASAGGHEPQAGNATDAACPIRVEEPSKVTRG